MHGEARLGEARHGMAGLGKARRGKRIESPRGNAAGTRSYFMWRLAGDAAGAYGALGETKHVGAHGMLSASAAFIWRELVVRIDFAFEAPEKRIAGGSGAGAAIGRSAPGDFGGDSLVDVLRW
jgi:hypothetical protein